MSNCIKIYDPLEWILQDGVDIDVRGLLASLLPHRDHTDYCPTDPLVCQAARWFLIYRKNLLVDGNKLTIRLGRGRSSHTNRDFAQTLTVVSMYLLKPVQLSVRIADEFDDFYARFTVNYRLAPGREVERSGL